VPLHPHLGEEEVPSSPHTWFPLATEQLRLRGVTEVSLYHPQPGCEAEVYHLTFHTTPLSSPFFTSSPGRVVEEKVVWGEVGVGEGMGGSREVVVRVWGKGEGDPVSLVAWGVGLSGLVCIGDKLSKATTNTLAPNSLVFKLHQYYFVANDSLVGGRVVQWRRLEVPNIALESGKPSYDRSALAKVHATLRALRQSSLAVEAVKGELGARGLLQAGGDLATSAPHHRSISSKILEVRVRQPATRRQEQALQARMEDGQFRLACLRRERDRLARDVAGRRARLAEAGGSLGSAAAALATSRQALARDREQLAAWLASFAEARESNRRAGEALRLRRLHLISQLPEIFPISDPTSPTPTICFVGLPASDCLREREDTDLAVSLGWTAHLTLMVADLLGVPLRYPTLAAGSRSTVADLILDRIPDKDREFPLFPKGSERVRFDYGVFLLNKNIAQLRWFCGEGTADAKPTLRNLAGLVAACRLPAGGDTSTPEYKLPEAPPTLAGTALAPALQEVAGEEEHEMEVEEVMEVEVESGVEVRSGGEEANCDILGGSSSAPGGSSGSESCSNPSQHPSPHPSPSHGAPQPPSPNHHPLASPTSHSPKARGSEVQNGEVEEAVEAEDLFRDIAVRTAALAAPASFKSRQRLFK